MAHAAPSAEISLQPDEGWHCSHLFYAFDRQLLRGFSRTERNAGCGEIMAALEGFDIYDARLEPVTRETVSARLHSRDPKPGWGTVFGNFFEVALVPRGEPLRKVRGPRGPMAASA